VIDQDRVADGDPAVVQDVGVEPAAMDQLLDDPRPRHLLKVSARLADLDTEALDVAHPEALADQIVQPHPAHHHLTARLGAGEPNILQHFRLDQRQRLAGLGALVVEVAVAHEPLARQRVGGIDRAESTGAMASLGPMLIASTFTFRSCPVDTAESSTTRTVFDVMHKVPLRGRASAFAAARRCDPIDAVWEFGRSRPGASP
jgi:hypothetical protein